MEFEEKFGLNRRHTYNELVSYILRDPDKIKLPDRSALFLRATLYMAKSGIACGPSMQDSRSISITSRETPSRPSSRGAPTRPMSP